MFEIATAILAEITEETRNVAKSKWIGFIVNSPIEMLIINLLDFQAIILIFDIMLEVADITSASAGVIAIFGHNFDSQVIITFKNKIIFINIKIKLIQIYFQIKLNSKTSIT